MKSRTSALGLPAPYLVTMMTAAMLLVLVLVVQSWATDRYHREVSEAVLRDYAALAADEALRRIAVEVGYYGYDPAIAALRGAAATGLDVPDPAHLLVDASEQTARALRLVDDVFLINTATRHVMGTVKPGLRSILAQRATETELNERGFASALLEDGEDTTPFVFGTLDPAFERQDGANIIGFRVNVEALRTMCEVALGRRALLPPSLGEGDLDNTVLYLRVMDGARQDLYVSKGRYVAGLVVERQAPDDYASIFEGFTVRAAIDPDAAHRLVIGGLPQSRLPLLLTLFVLTAGLLVAAMVLIRRERALIQLRSDFVSRVSHELRTPLTQIRMFAETLRLGRVRNEREHMHYLTILEREARRLTGLVENVLQFSRTERGQAHLEVKPTAIAAVFDRLAEEMKPFLDARGCTLEVVLDREIVAPIDPDAIHQSLLNLVDNAVKHGPEGQSMVLSAQQKRDKVLIALQDQGPGIPLSDHERVWLPYRRVEGSSQTGTGIGMAVVRDLIEQHGGRSWIESNDDGEPPGTQIVLELPCPPKAAP